jgi:trehalose utilization protein
MENKIRVTIWNEFRHEKSHPEAMALYPNGLHATIKEFLSVNEDLEITLAALDDPDQGLPPEVLDNTDVLIWWGHMAHREVDDALVTRIQRRVYLGRMGFIALHSSHRSKPFCAIVGTTGNLSWGRNQKEIMWNMLPTHPIAEGIPDCFFIESEELYAEPFFIAQPDELIFGGWYEDGCIFRSGMTFRRDAGKIFYFQPGHETCPSFYNPYVQRIITNAVYWCAPSKPGYAYNDACPHRTSRYHTLLAEGKIGPNSNTVPPVFDQLGISQDK